MKNRFHLIILALLTVVFVSCGREQHNDEDAIRSQAEAYSIAYNSRDSKKLASFWSKDAFYINPLTGDAAEGQAEITEYFQNRFANGPEAKLKIDLKNISFPEKDNALAEGRFRLSYGNEPDVESAFKAEFVKENNTWLLQEINEIELHPAPSHYDHLKELNWLVGNWIDQDENVEIQFSAKWDKYKNFIIQQFASKVLSQDQLEGIQIIGWDPIENKIRSWIFDSDGGFGKGFWTKEEDNWYTQVTYTLNDGGKASATQIIHPIDSDSYTFESVARDVDGEILPDIEPVKVVRSKKESQSLSSY